MACPLTRGALSNATGLHVHPEVGDSTMGSRRIRRHVVSIGSMRIYAAMHSKTSIEIICLRSLDRKNLDAYLFYHSTDLDDARSHENLLGLIESLPMISAAP